MFPGRWGGGGVGGADFLKEDKDADDESENGEEMDEEEEEEGEVDGEAEHIGQHNIYTPTVALAASTSTLTPSPTPPAQPREKVMLSKTNEHGLLVHRFRMAHGGLKTIKSSILEEGEK